MKKKLGKLRMAPEKTLFRSSTDIRFFSETVIDLQTNPDPSSRMQAKDVLYDSMFLSYYEDVEEQNTHCKGHGSLQTCNKV